MDQKKNNNNNNKEDTKIKYPSPTKKIIKRITIK